LDQGNSNHSIDQGLAAQQNTLECASLIQKIIGFCPKREFSAFGCYLIKLGQALFAAASHLIK